MIADPTQPPAPPPRLADPWLLAVGAAALLFYGAQLAPWALGGDNTQFITLSQHPGVPHPPGYPLYMWLLQPARGLAALLSPAQAAAAVTAVIAAVGVWLAATAAQAWGASRGAAAWAGAMIAASPLAAHLGTHAEVFALNATLCAAILAASAPNAWAWCRGGRRLAALGLLGGLALSHHHSAVLVAPAGLFGVWLGWREAERPWPALGLSGALLSGTIAALYGSLWALAQRDDLVQRWGVWTDLQGLVDHVLRREFGTLQLSSSTAEPVPRRPPRSTGHRPTRSASHPQK